MEHSLYVDLIKKSLKARNIDYKELSLHLKMSESGVKKMLNGKDISFQRVLQICRVLNVLPGQLFSLSEKASLPVLDFTEKQQESLIKDRRLLSAYWLLTIEKKSIEEISLSLQTTPTQIKHLLQKLVSLDLILHRKSQFFPKHTGKFKWPDDSKLARILNQEWSELTLKKSLKTPKDHFSKHRLVALKLSEASYQKCLQKFSDLFDEMAQQSERDELITHRQDLHNFTLMLASAEGSFFDSWI